MTAKIDVTLKSGEKLVGNTFFDIDPFYVDYDKDKHGEEIAQASNTARRNTALSTISGLFTLDGSQDEFKDGQLTSPGVNFRETRVTRLRVLDPNGVLIIIAAPEVSYVKMYDEAASTPAPAAPAAPAASSAPASAAKVS